MRLDHLLSKDKVRACALTVNTLKESAKRDSPVAIRIGETPVPIPNTTVKTNPAEDTRAKGHGKIGGCRAFLS